MRRLLANLLKGSGALIAVGVLLTMGSFGLFISGSGFIQAMSNYAYDALLRQTHEDPKSGRVAIVDIDEATLQDPAFGQWPWPRYLVADLTRKTLEAGASVVAFDILFAEQDRTSPVRFAAKFKERFGGDVRFEGVTADALDFDKVFASVLSPDRTILGCMMMPSDELVLQYDPELDPEYQSRFFGRGSGGDLFPLLMQASGMAVPIRSIRPNASIAFFNALMDTDSIVRSNPLIWSYGPDRIYPSLSLEAIRLDQGIGQGIVRYDEEGVIEIKMGNILIPTDGLGRMVVNYRTIIENEETGFVSSFPLISARDVLNGTVAPEALTNKIVFIGTSAVGLKDVRATPLTQFLSGVEVHANMVDNILSGDTLRAPAYMVFVQSFGIIFCGLFLTFAVARGRSWISFLMALAMTAALVFTSLYLLRSQHLVFVPVWVIVSVLIVYSVLTVMRFWQEELQKKKIRNMFGTMVSHDVMQYLEKNPESFSLTGRKVEATMFFSDVAGFTTISESLPPDRLTELLNRYLSPMTEIIMSRRGYVDKYEGDAIMAVWGAPFTMADHAVQACVAAIEQQKKLDEIREDLRNEFGHTIHVRMGINSGAVTAGNMGSSRRFSYTVMGDAVNQAARFEPANKDYGTRIMIGETTWELARGAVDARLLDRIVVKGKTKPIQIYELLAIKGQGDARKMQVCAFYDEGLRLHWERKWDAALAAFVKALELDPQDGPSINMTERVRRYQVVAPPDGWAGEYVRTSKD